MAPGRSAGHIITGIEVLPSSPFSAFLDVKHHQKSLTLAAEIAAYFFSFLTAKTSASEPSFAPEGLHLSGLARRLSHGGRSGDRGTFLTLFFRALAVPRKARPVSHGQDFRQGRLNE